MQGVDCAKKISGNTRHFESFLKSEDLNSNIKFSSDIIITYFLMCHHQNRTLHYPKAPGYALAPIANDDMTTSAEIAVAYGHSDRSPPTSALSHSD